MGELAADQVADGDQVPGGAENSSAALGDLDLTVHAFDGAVGQTRVEGIEDALPVRLERQSQALERLQPTAPGPVVPGVVSENEKIVR